MGWPTPDEGRNWENVSRGLGSREALLGNNHMPCVVPCHAGRHFGSTQVIGSGRTLLFPEISIHKRNVFNKNKPDIFGGTQRRPQEESQRLRQPIRKRKRPCDLDVSHLPENLEHEEDTPPVHSLPLFNLPIKGSIPSPLLIPLDQVLLTCD